MEEKIMKKMYGFIALLTVLLIIAFVSAKKETNEERNHDVPVIGILQITSHPALDAIHKGIIDGLSEEGYQNGETIKVEDQNPQGDQSNLNTMSQRLVSKDVDILAAIATPSAQALANATEDIPIILAGVTDPESSNLVKSNKEPGGNITGVADQLPIKEQISLMKELMPAAKNIGILYSSSEDNSIINAKEAEKIAEQSGFKVKTMTVSSTNDVAQAGSALADQVDAIWVPSDNTIASALNTLLQVTDEKGIPVFPPVDTMVKQGGLATVGINQYEMGKQAGKMAAAILDGEEIPANTSIQSPIHTNIYMNQQKAKQLGIHIPSELKEQAVLFH